MTRASIAPVSNVENWTSGQYLASLVGCSAMRLLYSFPHPLGTPGIGWAAFHQVQELIRRGVEVTLVCTSLAEGYEVDGARAVSKTLAIGGKRVPHRALGVDRAYRYHDWRVARILESHGQDFDLVHTWPRATLRTALAAHAAGIPVVREAPNTHTRHAYDVVAREHEQLGLPLSGEETHAFDAHKLATEEAEYALADVILVPSPLAEETFTEHGVEARKLAINDYGFESDRFTPGDQRPLEGRPLRVLFAARCEPRKGLHHALAAWHKSGLPGRGARLVICGTFIPGYRERLESMLDQPGIEVRGFVDDLERIMRETDVFLLPSVEEGSALVTYGAQGSGCVPVVSDASGARVTHLETGLVHAAGDVATLTEHLRLADEDRALLAQMRERSIAAAGSLTWAQAAERLHRTYERAIASYPYRAAPSAGVASAAG
jgi:glycosyltransferase involved in cell wall biosynthesis